MPRLIDYSVAQKILELRGLRCLYHNSGAYGFTGASDFFGFIGPEDSSVKSNALANSRKILPPYERNLTQLACSIWQNHLPGEVWVMPKSHWSYELSFGSLAWMPAVLEKIGVDPTSLIGCNNGSPIELARDQSRAFEFLLEELLTNLHGSDFMLAFPGYPVLCTVHHHKQLWWQSSDNQLFKLIKDIELRGPKHS